jgi:dTMP kinase
MTLPGKFITLEGGEGTGKSTQVKKLAEFLHGKGLQIVETREPGGSPLAEAIRNLWLDNDDWDNQAEILLSMAARREHLVKTVWPALQRGDWVVSDRFVDSARAYQGLMTDAGIKAVNDVYNLIAPGFEADLTLLLDLPIETSMARITARGGASDRYDAQDAAYHRKLRDCFLGLAKDQPRFVLIDAAQDLAGVQKQIEQAVSRHFKL